jgi:hypothetical protein
MHSSPSTYYIIFTAVTALGILLQAVVLLAIFFAVRKAIGKLHEVTDDVRQQALPVIASTRSLLEDISPKLKIATSNLTEVSYTLRHQANHVNKTMEALLNKTDVQIDRIDEMVTGAFNAVDQASRVVEKTVSVPARRVSGIVNGFKAGMEVFIGRKKQSAPNGPGAGKIREQGGSGSDDPDQIIQPPPTTSSPS